MHSEKKKKKTQQFLSPSDFPEDRIMINDKNANQLLI